MLLGTKLMIIIHIKILKIKLKKNIHFLSNYYNLIIIIGASLSGLGLTKFSQLYTFSMTDTIMTLLRDDYSLNDLTHL